MNMGRPYPTLRDTAAGGRVVTRAALLFVFSLAAFAVHPILLVIAICLVTAIALERVAWLHARLERIEAVQDEPRKRRRTLAC